MKYATTRSPRSRRRAWKIASSALILLALAASAEAQAVLRVPADFLRIQEAIDASVSGDTVLVAPGTYFENLNYGGKDIALVSGGGAQVTTIDGDQAGTVVVFENGETAAAILDGFTITGGQGTVRPAGGIYCGHASPTIRRCVIIRNRGMDLEGGAGGIQCGFASPRILDCTIRQNVAGSGDTSSGAGGMTSKWDSAPVVVGCLFEENRGGGNAGPGAVECGFDSSPRFVECTFRANLGSDSLNCATAGAGAVGCDSAAATFRECVFDANVAGQGKDGPGAAMIGGGNVLFAHCLFTDNLGSYCPGVPTTQGGPGAIDCGSSPARIQFCEFRSNAGRGADAPGAISMRNTSGADILDCTFIENRGGPLGPGNPGAIGFESLANGQPQIARCLFQGNVGGVGTFKGGAGAIWSTRAGSITDCDFRNNRGGDATNGDGGPGVIDCDNSSIVAVDSCRLIGNTGGVGFHGSDDNPGAARGGAGAIGVLHGEPVFRNCVLARNHGGSSPDHAAGPGAIKALNSAPRFINCTVVDNVAGVGAGSPRPSGMVAGSGMQGDVLNSIFRNDPGSDEIQCNSSCSITVAYSVVRGGFVGTGNLDVDPLLVDAAADDFHLRCASPCRDTGASLDPEQPEFDFEGDPRVFGTEIDMGADEYGVPGAGSNYCVSSPNSTGTSAVIDALGCNAIGDGILPLAAGPVPDTFGAFYYGATPLQVPFANGTRCVANPSFRLPFRAITNGRLTTDLDYSNPPQSAGQITAGATWYFQAYFRDPAAGGGQVDLSDGLQITFVP